jgi:putative peptidoglycan lipid II flippase
MTLGIAVFQINVLVDNAIAEALIPGDGAVSSLYYANRLFNFPLALIGIAVAQAAFPEFADAFARGRRREMSEAFSRACRLVLFLALPASAGLAVLSTPIIRMIFEHGSFGAEQTRRAAGVLAFYGIGTWAACLQHVVVRAFHAARDAKTPAMLGACAVLMNAGLNLLFIRWWAEAGLALGTSVTAAVQVAVLGALLRKRLPETRWSPLIAWSVLPLALAAATAAGAWALARALSGHILLAGLAPVAAGAGVYFAAARALGMPEAREALSFRRRRSA